MSEVTLVNYGLGNVKAFSNIFEWMNVSVDIATSPSQVKSARRLILPGVGAFDWAIRRLNASGMRESLDEAVLDRKIAVLGVCVGMQIMAERSDEGVEPGLGWIKGEVRAMANLMNNDLPLPHMGWNEVTPVSTNCIFQGIREPQFYFLHSFCMVPSNIADCLANSSYGEPFVSAVRHNKVFGTQFHPEKSHHWGIDLLRNFLRQ